MTVFLKIAFRNLIKNKRRSLLIVLSLLISCTLLLFCYAIGNGTGAQIIRKYRDFQSGDVAVVWKNVKTIETSDPSRLFFSNFEIKNDRENQTAMARLDQFLSEHRGEIIACHRAIRGTGMLDNGRYASFTLIFGLEQEEMDYYLQTDNIRLVAGETPFAHEYGVCLSDDLAAKNGIHVGDWVTLDSTTPHGLVNTLEYEVVGLYRASSEFDSIHVYMSRENALELFDQGPMYFQSARIYLKNPGQASAFAAALDSFLTAKSDLLRAEPLDYAGEFYRTIAVFEKSLFSFFVVFILLIIAVGIRSAVRMSIFERMREFGTLRAIGYHRGHGFLLVFLEVFFLSLIALGISLIVTFILVLIFGHVGIFIGKGPIAYALGGESIYPVMQWQDTLTALLMLILFSLYAPLGPGLKLCYQKITDLLEQNQKPVWVLRK